MRKRLWVGGGLVAALLVVAALETVLGRAAPHGSAYQPVTIPFQVRALGVSGWADLADPVDLRVAVRAPRDAVALARVPSQVLDLVDDGGWVTVPLRVTGAPQSPSVTADGEALREMGGRAVRAVVRQQVERGVSRVLGKLFGNR